MIHLSPEIEALAQRLATAQGVSIEEAVKRAIEQSARAAGVVHPRRRLSVEQMLAVGGEIAAMPLLDPRLPREITDDLNAA